jgi:hypothetical protein
MASPIVPKFDFHFMNASSGGEESQGSSTVTGCAFKDLTPFICEVTYPEAFKVKLAIMQCMEDLKIKSLSFMPKNPEKKQTIYIENFTPLASPTLEGLFKPFPSYRLEEKPPVRVTNHADMIASAMEQCSHSLQNLNTPFLGNGTRSGSLTEAEKAVFIQALSFTPTYRNVPDMLPELLVRDDEVILELADVDDIAVFKTLQKIALLLKEDPETYALSVGFLDGAKLKTKSWMWRTDLDTNHAKMDALFEHV